MHRSSTTSLLLRLSTFALLTCAGLGSARAQTPTITNLTPSRGIDAGGTLVTITGTNLDTTTSVSLGANDLSNLIVIDAATVTGNAPPGTPGNVDVTVTTAAGSATRVAGYTYLPCTPAGGSALDFFGHYVQFPAAAVTGEHTLEAWIRPVVAANTYAHVVVNGTGPGTNCTNGTTLRMEPSNRVQYALSRFPCGAGSGINDDTTTIVPGAWYHLAGTYDGSLMTLYVDGVNVGEFPGATMQVSNWMTVGAIQYQVGAQFFFGGLIDEVRVWDHARTQQEILDTMFRPLTGAEPGLAGYWNFDEGTGQTVADSSPTGTPGTLGFTAGVDSRDPTWVSTGAPLCVADPCAATPYCTAGTTAGGCRPAISGVGRPSVSESHGFVVSVDAMEGQKNGIFFYGLSGPKAAPWGAGSTSFLCVQSPTQRMGLLSSGGTSGACDGRLSLDFNTWNTSHTGRLGQPFSAGTDVWIQGWFRDPPSPRGTSLSDGLHFVLCP